MEARLTIGMLDDTPAGLGLMEELVDSVLRNLDIKAAAVDLKSTSDRREAQEIAASGQCDLLLVDLMWPTDDGGSWRTGLDLAQMGKNANDRTVVVVVTGKQDQEEQFRTDAKARKADLTYGWREAFLEGKSLTASEIADRLRPAASQQVPEVVSWTSSTIGLVGLDTVAYSEADDDTQISVVKSFLSYTRESWEEIGARDPLVRTHFLFTGDGLIMGLAGDQGPRLALDLALVIRGKLVSLARYRTRLAVHAGPVAVATLSDGNSQLLGHAVNWLCRAMNAAAEDGLVITDEYYNSYLQSGREIRPGMTLTRRTVSAKHRRPLILHDVTQG